MNEDNISFEELLNNSMKDEKLGKVVEGTIISITKSGEIIVDLNYKADGIIPRGEYSYNLEDNPLNDLKVGDKIIADVIKLNDGQGNVLLSCKKRKRIEARNEFENKVNNNEIFDEPVLEKNDKGLIVDYKGIRIFIPHSLSANQTERVRFKVIEYNPKEHRIIGSAKIILDEEKKKKEDEFWNNAEVGKTYKGIVNSICSYGAFVDINGVQGLLHVSEMSWDRGANPKEILKPNQEINVRIKALDKENKRMQLTYEGKGEDPWKKANYKVGDIVRVKIKKLMPFGAFAEIEKGIEGLIHISQISEERITKPEEKLKVGQKVNAKIIDVNLEDKKIELSVKELEGTSNEYNSEDEKIENENTAQNS